MVEQQQGNEEDGGTPAARDDFQSTASARESAAAELATAFYAALGVGLDAVTPAIRRRDLVIARDLLAAGATADEAAAYVHETAAAHGRIAPLDLTRRGSHTARG